MGEDAREGPHSRREQSGDGAMGEEQGQEADDVDATPTMDGAEAIAEPNPSQGSAPRAQPDKPKRQLYRPTPREAALVVQQYAALEDGGELAKGTLGLKWKAFMHAWPRAPRSGRRRRYLRIPRSSIVIADDYDHAQRAGQILKEYCGQGDPNEPLEPADQKALEALVIRLTDLLSAPRRLDGDVGDDPLVQASFMDDWDQREGVNSSVTTHRRRVAAAVAAAAFTRGNSDVDGRSPAAFATAIVRAKHRVISDDMLRKHVKVGGKALGDPPGISRPGRPRRPALPIPKGLITS